jgi:ABC-type multidrug transport system ATPase subunit
MIALENVFKCYGRRPVLKGVNLHVEPGEVVALVGPNGAGKSTALRIVAGIVRPDQGRATINGHDTGASPVARRSLGYLPQKLGVPLTTTVRDLARLITDIRGVPFDLATAALEEAKLDHRVDAALGELSGGQKQRIMLILATVGPVTSLLLDEPSISLDADGSEDVRALIRAAQDRGSAVLFASHHLSDVAALADRLAVMVEGQIIAQGTLLELAERAGIKWSGSVEPPIEAIYRTLVTRSRAARGPVTSPIWRLVTPRDKETECEGRGAA